MKIALAFNAVRNCWFARINGNLFVLSRHAAALGCTDEREYMIVDRLGKHPRGYLVEPVVAGKHVLVKHSGFETSGSMCRTTAFRTDMPTATIQQTMLTPGRVFGVVQVTDNTKHGWARPVFTRAELERIYQEPDFSEANLSMNREKGPIIAWYKAPARRPVPNTCYIEIGDNRACGLPDISCCAVIEDTEACAA